VGATTNGVDVSEFQGGIDWNAVKASGHDFAFIRVGDGFYFDARFDDNWQAAADAHVVRGAYQFFRPGEDGTAQADWFLQHVSGGELAPTLDVEVTDGQSSATIVAGIAAWVARIQAVTGKQPIIYTAPGFWSGIAGADGFGTTLWVAHWFTNCPDLPLSWDRWTFWQYADNGGVPGIPGAVDLDVFNGTLDQLVGTDSARAQIAPVTVGVNADGRLEVFAAGTDTQVWHSWQVVPGGGWAGFWGLTGSITGAPAVAANADGRLEVFARGGDHRLWHQWQLTPSGAWSGFWPMTGSMTDSPTVAINQDGRLEVFVRGSDGQLWHQWQLTPGGGWSGFWPMTGSISGTPAVARNADGRLEVFVRGGDGQLWHQWQVVPGGAWSGFWPMTGSITDSPAVASNADGRLEVFVRGGDGQLWHTWQTAPGAGWSSLAVAQTADGRLEVFVRGGDGQLWHQWQRLFDWSGFEPLTGQITDAPAVSRNADGRLEVFARGADGALWHQWQTTANGGWSGFVSLGFQIASP
jgi:GH25 family lysozyme M1 (1,4-beta-N-acetylmuramidase)